MTTMLSVGYRARLTSWKKFPFVPRWRHSPNPAPAAATTSLHSSPLSRHVDYKSCISPDNIVRSPFPDITPSGKNLFRQVFDEFPKHTQKIALVDGVTGREYSFAELEELTARTSSALNRLGFSRGDVLALCAPNVPEYAAIFFATLASGGVVSTCNPSYKSDEFLYQFRDSGASVVVTMPQILPEVQKAAAEAGIKHVVVIDEPGQAGQTGQAEGLLSYQELISDTGSRFDPSLASSWDDIAVLPYSSGTTGLPKGVMLTNGNIISNFLQFDHPQLLNHGRDSTLLGLLPFFHIYGMVVILLSSLHTGAKTVTLPRFEPETFLTAIQIHRVTALHAVPPIVLFLAKHPLVEKFDLSSVTEAMSGAAPLGAEVVRAARERTGCNVRQGYGLTETSPVTHLTPRELANSFAKPGSIGVPLRSQRCMVVEPDSCAVLPAGEEGELWLAGPNIMKGYLNNPEATREAITKGGWFRSGDIAYFDKDGCFYITDRLKELIKVKGLQVAPAELEALLVTHDKIADAAVVAMPHERLGEAPRAFVVKKDETLTERDVVEFVSAKVAEHKRLAGGVVFLEAVPKSASGKILRRMLRER